MVRDKSIINPWKVVNMDTGEEMALPETPEQTTEILPLDRTSQLTANQEDVYNSMKEKFPDIDKNTIVRFLRARDFKLEKAVKLLSDAE